MSSSSRGSTPRRRKNDEGEQHVYSPSFYQEKPKRTGSPLTPGKRDEAAKRRGLDSDIFNDTPVEAPKKHLMGDAIIQKRKQEDEKWEHYRETRLHKLAENDKKIFEELGSEKESPQFHKNMLDDRKHEYEAHRRQEEQVHEARERARLERLKHNNEKALKESTAEIDEVTPRGDFTRRKQIEESVRRQRQLEEERERHKLASKAKVYTEYEDKVRRPDMYSDGKAGRVKLSDEMYEERRQAEASRKANRRGIRTFNHNNRSEEGLIGGEDPNGLRRNDVDVKRQEAVRKQKEQAKIESLNQQRAAYDARVREIAAKEDQMREKSHKMLYSDRAKNKDSEDIRNAMESNLVLTNNHDIEKDRLVRRMETSTSHQDNVVFGVGTKGKSWDSRPSNAPPPPKTRITATEQLSSHFTLG